MSEQNRYFIVDPKSETHAKIEEINQRRVDVSQARWDFMEREFPSAKKRNSGWAIVYGESAFGGSSWAIKAPDGEPVPADWKVDKRDGCWLPRHSTKRGKALAKEMGDKKYAMPGAAAIGSAIGSPSVWVGMTLHTIGIRYTNDGRWLLSLMKGHKVPAGVTRISDIDVEQLTAEKKKRKRVRVCLSGCG